MASSGGLGLGFGAARAGEGDRDVEGGAGSGWEFGAPASEGCCGLGSRVGTGEEAESAMGTRRRL